MAREGWPFVGLVLILALGLAGVTGSGAAGFGFGVPGGLAMAFFFRDPRRRPPADERLVVAGADGVVRAVTVHARADGEDLRVSTYLSLCDVHVNRVPCAGRVVDVAVVRGRHQWTGRDAASFENQHTTTVLATPRGRVAVRQITGPLVRRVVAYARPGRALERGERLGIMKFGSRLDVYLPAAAVEVLVRPGDRVRAGESAIARWRDEAAPR